MNLLAQKYMIDSLEAHPLGSTGLARDDVGHKSRGTIKLFQYY